MRNLKRALSLTLASVMLLGMMVVGTSAASYPDVDAEDNVEAIEVVQAVGVMVGDERGNFNPGTQVTRNEMAVIMAKLILGPDLAETYVGICPFWDVPDWAQKYVAACYDNNIVAGIGGGAYGGDQTVTAEQAAAMMLRALGYTKLTDDSGDWARPVVAMASRIQLFTGVGTNPKETLTRNQVAQLTLNTLESGTVEAQDSTMNFTGSNGDTTFTISGGQVSYVYVTSADTKYNGAINNLGATSVGQQNTGLIVELGEKLYSGDLKLNDDDVDDFGRPSRTWTYKNDSVGTYAKGTELIATYTAKVSKGDIYGLLSSAVRSDLESNSNGTAKLTVTVDGQITKNGNTTADADTWYVRNSSDAIYTFPSVDGSTRNGTLTEVYLDSDNNVDIVIINTYVYQATSDYSATRDDVKMAPAGDTVLALKGGELTLSGEDFNITDVKTNDYLLITAASTTGTAYEVKSVQVAETVTGEVTGYANQNSVTIDGTTYNYSAICNKNGSYVRDTTYTVGQDAVVVLDAYGYIIAVDEAVSSSSFVFIAKTGGTSGLNTKAVGDAYFTDGKNEEITIDRIGDMKNANTIATGTATYGNQWYTFSVNSDGKYVLYPLTSGRNNANKAYTASGDTQIVTNGKVDFLNGSSAIANDKTIMIVKDNEGDVTAYTGTANIPDINLPNTKTATVYYATNSKGYTEYAFVDLTGTGASVVDGGDDTSFLYVLRFGDELSGSNATRYYTYSTINPETGAEEKVSFDSRLLPGNPYELRYKPRYNSDDRITSLTAIPNEWNNPSGKYFNRAIAGDKIVTFSEGSLKIGSENFIVAGDSKISLVIVKDSSTLPLLADKGANHEFYFETQAQTVASLLKDYAVTGTIAGATKSATSSVIDTLYITVTKVGSPTPATPDEINGDLDDAANGATVEKENVNVGSGTISVEDGKTLVLSGSVSGTSGTIQSTDNSGTVEIGEATVSGTLSVTADATLTGAVTVATGAALTLAGTTIDADADVNLEGTASLTAGDATIEGDVTLAGTSTMTVDNAEVKGTLTLGADTTLTVNEDLTTSGTGAIVATEDAKITVAAGASNPSGLLAAVSPAKFYIDGVEVADASQLAGKTFTYQENYTYDAPGGQSLSREATATNVDGWIYESGNGGGNEGDDKTDISGLTVTGYSALTVGQNFPEVTMTGTGIADAGITGEWALVGGTIGSTVADNSQYTLTFTLAAKDDTFQVPNTVTAPAIGGVNGTYTKPNIVYTFTVGTVDTPQTYTVSVSGVDDYTVAGIDSNGYAKDASVTITLTQKTGADLAEGAKFTVTSSDIENVEGTVTTAGVTAVPAGEDTYTKAENITNDNFSSGEYYTKGEDGTYTKADSFADDTEYYTKTPGTAEVSEVKGVITITFTMPEKNVSITGITAKAADGT